MAGRAPPPRTHLSQASNVRRNLFSSQLSRRPTSTSTSSSATTLYTPSYDSSSDVIVRDRNGNCQVGILSVPPQDEEQAQEEDGCDQKELDLRLLELHKNRNLQPSDPSELLTAVQASLRHQVSALKDDAWIYEAEKKAPE